MTTRFKLRIDKGNHSARILYDTEWDEFVVWFYKHGKHLSEQATYHTDDLEDARSTAIAELNHMEVGNGNTT